MRFEGRRGHTVRRRAAPSPRALPPTDIMLAPIADALRGALEDTKAARGGAKATVYFAMQVRPPAIWVYRSLIWTNIPRPSPPPAASPVPKPESQISPNRPKPNPTPTPGA